MYLIILLILYYEICFQVLSKLIIKVAYISVAVVLLCCITRCVYSTYIRSMKSKSLNRTRLIIVIITVIQFSWNFHIFYTRGKAMFSFRTDYES